MLKASLLTTVLIALELSTTALAGCRTYWEGTAPFCNQNCPKGCTSSGTLSTHGNGARCLTGKKQVCTCCGPRIQDEALCIPSYTKPVCYGLVMMCFEVVTDVPYRDCGFYACGVCFGGPVDMPRYPGRTPEF